MKIENDTVVTLRARIADDKGQLVNDGKEPMVYLHGGYDNTLPKIEEALEGREPGAEVSARSIPSCSAPSPRRISRPA